MDQIQRDHEQRISRVEGEMKSVATKEFVKEVVDDLRKEISNKIDDQTRELRQSLKEQNDAIRELREKESRLKGVADTLKVALPFLVSAAAVLIALLK